MNWTQSAALSACLAAACAATPAWAVLGGTAASVQEDAAALNGTAAARATSQSAYTVQRLSLQDGTRVDEYLSASGMVFALTWHGVRAPDLQQLLGSYYVEFRSAAPAHGRQSQVRFDTGSMHYRAGGHMRAYWGSAYVPALAPAGLGMESLK